MSGIITSPENMEDDVFQLIYSMSRDISKESKELFELALEQTHATEEEIFPGFKAVSLKAHKMIALLKSCYEKGKPSLVVQQQLLRDSTSGFARAMLDFVGARKNLFLNPFDYLCQQTLSNSLKTLYEANKTIVSALDSYRQAMEEDEAENEKEEGGKTPPDINSPRVLSSISSPLHTSGTQRPVLTSVNSALFNPQLVRHESYRAQQKAINVITDKDAVTVAAHNVKEAVYNRDSDRFFKSVKEFVESVNRLFEIIKILSLDIPESTLKEYAVLLVNSGRAVLNSPEDDDVCSATFGEAVVKMDQMLQSFVYACSKSPVGRQSIRASVKVSRDPYPSFPSPLASPIHSYSSHTERGFPLARPDMQPSRLVKSSSDEAISDEPNRATSDKKSRSNPNLALRSSQIMGRAPALSPASSPATQSNPTSSADTPDAPGGWERAEAVKRTVSRPVINIAHTTPQAVLASIPSQSSGHAALLPVAGMTRLVTSPSTPSISSPPQTQEKEKMGKMTRSVSAQIPSPSSNLGSIGSGSNSNSNSNSTRDGEDNAYYEIALTVAAVLCERYPTFEDEWKRHTPAQREATLDKIVARLASTNSSTSSLLPPSLSSSTSSSPSSLSSSLNSSISSTSSSLPSTPTNPPPPLSLSGSSGSVTPPLSSKPRNKPEKSGKKDKHEKEKDKHEKEKDKHEKEKEKEKEKDKDKHEKEKHKKDKGPLRLITRANSGTNLTAEVVGLVKSPSAYVSDESITHLRELVGSMPGEWIASDLKKKRSKTIISRKKLVLEEIERTGSPAGNHIGEYALGLENNLTEFLGLINKGILSHEQTTLGAAPRNSSISVASIESLANSISGMRDNLKEVLDLHLKTLDEALQNVDGSDRKMNKKKEKSPQAVLELLQRLVTNAISLLENIPLKGKSNDAMTSALQGVTVNFINTKLKMEDTLEENICSECTNLRGCVTQIVLELRNNGSVSSEEQPFQGVIFQLASSAHIFADTMQKVLDSIATLRYVMMSETSFSSSIKINDGTSDDVNIWEDTTEILFSDGVFRAGNLNKLVETLTSTEHIDNKYLSTFITTYQSITTPAEFFAKLVQRYNIPASTHLKEGIIKAIKVRVCIVLKYWIENQFRDFDQDMVTKLFSFIEKVLPNDGNAEVAKALSKQLKSKVNEVNARRNAMIIQSICTLGLNHAPSQLFSVFSPFEIAKQLTLIEYTLFSKIHPAELLSQSWNSRTARQHSTHVLDLIQRTNRLSFWIGSLLLWQPTLQQRVKVLSKVIALGLELRNLNNFNTLMGIVAGLSMSAVNRLKNTFKGLESKHAETLEKLQAVLNPGMSFKYYRQELAAAKGPCLPYLGTILSDLTFMEDGNPNSIPCPKTKKMLVNYAKRELINNVLLEIKLYQQVPFNIVRMDPLTSFLESLPCAEDKELYELSLLREPREAKTIR